MNPHSYEEYHLKHRHFRENYRKTIVFGAVTLLLALWVGFAQAPLIGPGIFANAGLALTGLLLLLALRNLHATSPQTRWGIWLKQRSEGAFPALIIGLQGWFTLLVALLLWFTISEIGFQPNGFEHTLFIGIFLLVPIRRILSGSEPIHPHPRRELIAEALTCLNICLITLLTATITSDAALPATQRFSAGIPPTIVLIWVAATLIMLTSVILLLDHIVRKMPSTEPPEARDTLD